MSETAAIHDTLLHATVEHLTRFAPFSEMQRADLEWMASRLSLSYFPKDSILLEPEQGVVTRFFVIKQGSVVSERVEGDAEAHTQLLEGECFPLGALLSSRPVANVFRAAEDAFCYQLKDADFAELLQRSPPFHDFCTRRIAHLLERSKQLVQAQYTQASSAQQPLSTPLRELVRRAPVMCAPGVAIKDVLARMHGDDVGSMIIAEGEQPLGIFTLHDLLGRVALKEHDLQAPISSVMTPQPIGLSLQSSAYEAALVMARHGIRHVLVLDGKRCVGVVSERDLFSVQRVGLTQINTNIRNAKDVQELVAVAGDIRTLAHSMLAQGVGAEQLTQLVSTLNDTLTVRAIELVSAGFNLEGIEYCWLAFGSEGRCEQTLSTDQDNGIIFVLPEGAQAGDLRERLLPFARAVNEALDVCGFPLCKGGIMASNPKWCLSLAEWQEAFFDWIDHGDPQALLNATIFFDFRSLHGRTDLAEALRTWLVPLAKNNTRFLHQMAANALRNRPPLGLVRDFAVGVDHTLDLKFNGVSPFIDAARIFSLAEGVVETNSAERFRRAAERMGVPEKEAEAWIDAFLFIQLLRLRMQHEQLQAGLAASNRIDPDRLNDLDRRILKEALRQARKLQSRLALNYNL